MTRAMIWRAITSVNQIAILENKEEEETKHEYFYNYKFFFFFPYN